MNNEPNKPVELTEKELAGIAGGAGDLEVTWLPTSHLTGKDVAEGMTVERGGESFVFVPAADNLIIQAYN